MTYVKETESGGEQGESVHSHVIGDGFSAEVSLEQDVHLVGSQGGLLHHVRQMLLHSGQLQLFMLAKRNLR